MGGFKQEAGRQSNSQRSLTSICAKIDYKGGIPKKKKRCISFLPITYNHQPDRTYRRGAASGSFNERTDNHNGKNFTDNARALKMQPYGISMQTVRGKLNFVISLCAEYVLYYSPYCHQSLHQLLSPPAEW